jgi:signal peptidase I
MKRSRADERVARPLGTRAARRRFGVFLVAAFLCAWLFWASKTDAIPTRVYLIPSASMAPTIRPGDRVGVATLGGTRPKRGEIWVFRMPIASGNMPSEAVKRIVALPGETVEVKAGQVFIDGRPLREPYLPSSIGYEMPPLELGGDEFFVLGDSRNASHDSHVWGPLPGSHLVGPVKVRYWPPGRIKGF